MIDLTKKLQSSFLSCEKDMALILQKLFIQDKKKGEELKRLLIINTPDCLDNYTSEIYKKKLEEMSLSKMIDEGYICISPELKMYEHEEVKSYIIISFNDFTTNATNPEFRDCTVTFDVICHVNTWNLGNYRLRPLKIVGYIDGILNKTKLTGIGTFNFLGCAELVLNDELSGYTLMFRAIHGGEDKLEPEEDL